MVRDKFDNIGWLKDSISNMSHEDELNRALIDANKVLKLVDELEERHKKSNTITIPDFVAKFIEEKKNFPLYEIFNEDCLYENDKINRWLYDCEFETSQKREIDLILALRMGQYEVEREKKYYARLKKLTPPEGSIKTNLGVYYYWSIEESGLMLDEYLAEPVRYKNSASALSIKDWSKYGVYESDVDFIEKKED